MPRRIPTILSGGTAGAGGGSPADPTGPFKSPPPSTTAEWKAWASSALRQTALIEIEHPYEIQSAGPTYSIGTGTIYLSNSPFATESTDSPASISYSDVVTSVPTWSSSLDEQMPIGGARLQYGSIEVDNTDQRSNYLLQIPLQGRKVSIYYGDQQWNRGAFKLVLVARVQLVEATDINHISIRLTGASATLNRQIPTNKTADEYFRPLAYGYAYNCLPLNDRDSTNLTYWINDGSGVTISDVRDRGVSLKDMATVSGTYTVIVADPATDTLQPQTDWTPDSTTLVVDDVVTISSTGTYPTGLSAGAYWVTTRELSGGYWRYTLSATRGGSTIDISGDGSYSGTLTLTQQGYYDNGDGSFDLAHQPVGPVTADLYRTPALAYYAGSNGVIEALATVAGMSPGTDFVYSANLGTGWPNNPPVGFYMDEPMNLSDAIEWLTRSAFAFWADRYDGKVLIGRVIGLWATGTADWTFTSDDLIDRASLALRTTPRSYKLANIVVNRNWYVHRQDEFADAVTLDDRGYYSSHGEMVESLHGTVSYANQWSSEPYLYYEGASQSESYYMDSLIAGIASTHYAYEWAESSYLGRWFAFPADVVEFAVDLSFYDVELGDRITLDLTGSPLGISNSLIWIVTGKAVDLRRNRLTLTASRLHYWATPQTSQYYG